MPPRAIDPTFDSATPLEVGTVVAETYEVTAMLGRGGMGAVWAARHVRLPGKRVALKVLHGNAKDGPAFARFRREAEIASRLGHPNIVEVQDFNTLPDGTPYLVLEYLDGESLAARLLRGPFATPVALDVLRQVGSALHAAHRAGVVHRDLKPDNIFLCPSDAGGVVHDRVKVLDFGISKIRGSQTVVTQESVLMGTPQYMSPEQALGRNQEIDARTDLFALGAIVYEMLSGAAPFVRDQVATVMFAIVHQPHVPLTVAVPGIEPAIAAAVDRALAKSAGDRFPDVASFVEAATGRPLETLRGSDDAASRVAATIADLAGAPARSERTGGDGRAGAERPSGMPATAVFGAGAAAPEAASRDPSSGRAPLAPARRKSKSAAAVAAILALAAAAGAGVLVVRRLESRRGQDSGAVAQPPVARPVGRTVARPDSPEARTPPGAKDLPPPPAASSKIEKPVEKSVAEPGAEPAAKPGANPVERPAQATSRNHPRGAAHERESALPPEAAADVTAAEAALARGDAAAAERLAEHSLYAAKSSRAFAVVVRARCRKGDLGGARAALAHVGRAERPAVIRDCAARGIDLN